MLSTELEPKDMHSSWYKWPQQVSKDLFTGSPSRRAFDPSNGYQVQFLINCFAAFLGKQTLDDFRLIEHKLYNHLPIGLKSEISVFQWLKNECAL